ncbi:MAG: hypothetical protein EAZ57_11275 [Cytophagales bacterium]|nr:MAG: hypothetical protein EAZ67_12210 [Cytophagales bacterium]TAF59395.1 MAG: hypothetical protein EAZ57_11275 [Cytophagales bacterium]
MRRVAFFLMLYLVCVGFASAQTGSFWEFDERHAELGLEHKVFKMDTTLQLEYSLGFNAYLNEYFSLYYSIGTGQNAYSRRYYSGTAGMAAAYFVGSLLRRANTADSGEVLGYALILALIIPEGVQFHQKLGKNISLTPYLLPFGGSYNLDNSETIRLSGSVGFRLDIYPTSERGLYVSPQFGTRLQYSGLSQELYGGFRLAVIF